MSEPDAPLAAEFEPPTREAWLTLVDKVLKGGDFEKRLVSRTADGLAIQPLYTRADESKGAAPAGRTGWFPGGWDVRQRHVEPDPKAANAAILDDLAGGGTSLLLQIQAPGQAGLTYGAEALGAGAQGRATSTPAPLRSTRARTPWMPPAACSRSGATAGINENDRRGAFNYDPLGVLAKTGTLYYPPRPLLRDRRQARRRLPHHVARARRCSPTAGPITRPARSEAQELAAMLATLVAYLRACEAAGLQAAHGARTRSRSAWRPTPTCS